MITEMVISLAMFVAITLVFVLALTVFAPKPTAVQKYRAKIFRFYSDNEVALDPSKKTVFAMDFRLKEKRPFAIVVPGGGYENICNDTEGAPIAIQLNKLGYSAFVLNYRVGIMARCPAPQEDIGALVRYIQDHAKELNVEKSGYAVVGFSAGGHLAATFATKVVGYPKYGVEAPKTLILAYPVITMKEDTNHSSRNNLVGIDPDNKLVEKYSAEENVDADYPTVFMWRSAEDKVVPGDGADRFKATLDGNGIKNVYEIYPGDKHGGNLAIGTEMEGWFNRAVQFWRS